MGTSISQAELALALASDGARGDSEAHPLDRIRFQKAVFLLVKRGQESWRDLFPYRPYDWGPYSGALANELDHLLGTKRLVVEPVPGRRYGCYETTAAGEAEAEVVWERLDVRERAFIKDVRAYVTSKSFAGLLREVYAAYPEFATASRFDG